MSLTDEDKRWIAERLEVMETRLLTEFHKWASPVTARLNSHTVTMRALDLQLEALKAARIEGLETK